jgi:hypothetical protein
MKRLIILGTALVVTAVPAVTGLLGNQSFAQNVPVSVPIHATVAPAHPTPSASPSDDKGKQVEPGDDKGKQVEPGDDKSKQAESGDDKSKQAEPGDDKGSGSGHGSGHGGSDDGSGHQ